MAQGPTLDLFAQEAAPVCGDDEGLGTNWLCELILERTGNELLARLSSIGTTLVRVVAIVAAAFVVSLLLRRLVSRFAARMAERIEERLDRKQSRGELSDTQRFRTRRQQRLQAITGAMRGVVGVVVWLIAGLMVMSVLGFPLQPLLAGAGLAGIVLGFGAQQLVRDVLAGIAMLVEDQYGVGDWIEVDDKVGMVERVGLRSTGFRDIDGTMHHVLNGYIQRVGNLSQEWARATLDVPLALDTDVTTAKTLIHRVASELTEDALWGQDIIGAPEIWGVQSFGPEGLSIRVVIPTKPLRNFEVTRQLRERLKLAFDMEGIRMPSQLVDLGGRSDGYAVLIRDHREEPDREGLGRTRQTSDEPPTRPGESEERGSPVPEATDGTSESEEEPRERRDVTAELRMQRGPLPRLD